MQAPPHRRRPSRFEPDGKQILVHARELVEFGWCQGTDARDANGIAVDPWSASAACWSLLGALVAAVDLPAAPTEQTLGPLRRALAALAEVIDEPLLAAWNDDPVRTQVEVVGTLEAARVVCERWDA